MVVVLGLACGDSSDAPAGPGADSTPPDAGAIRDENFSHQSEVQAALTRIGGGKVAENEIAYADLTGDRVEEAVVPITSGGTMGNIAYLVFTPSQNGASLLLTRTLTPADPGGLNMTIEGGKLVEYVGEYGPEDPFCCPSVLRKTTFAWDGSKLQPGDAERVPAGQQKQ